ncbi:MAG TPA: hypothetical protein VGB95_04215, partial [Chitinophagales bacterium]
MKNRLPFLTLLLLLSAKTLVAQSTFTAFPQSGIVDTFWGTPVADPYRWLENLNSDSTKQWLETQTQITRTAEKQFEGNYLRIFYNLSDNGGAYFNHFQKRDSFYFQFESSYLSSPILYYKKSLNGFVSEAYNTRDFGKEPISIV